MEETIKNVKFPPKKKPLVLKNYPILQRFNISTKYKTLVAFLVLAVGLILTVYLVQRPTSYKSGATNQTSELVKGYNQKLKSMAGAATSAEIAIVAAQRKNLMLKLAKEDPVSFLEDVLDQTTLDKLPQIAKDQIEKRSTLEGIAAHIVVELENDGYTYYWLDDDTTNKRYFINFASSIPDITTGTKIKVNAYTLDDRAVSLEGEQNVQITSKVLGAAVGPFARNVLAIRVLLNDNKTQGYDTTATLGYLFNYSYSAKAFHKETSFGIVNFQGTITPYFSVPYSSTDACTNYGGPIITAINNAATAAGYNLSRYQHIVYLFPKGMSGCPVAVGTVGQSPSTTYQQKVWYFTSTTNSTYIASIYSHELGHNLGMSHANSLKCGSKTIDSYSLCTSAEYGDKFDTIGYGYIYYPQNNGPHKYLLGYLSNTNVIDVTKTGTYAIIPIETNTTSAQVLRIPKSTGDYYYVEYRRPLGVFDTDLPSSVTSGATLYIGTSNYIVNGGYRKTYILDTTPGDTAAFDNASFVDGRTFSDPSSYLTIKQVSHTTSSVTLSVTYTPPTPTPSPTPTLTPTPTPKPTFTPTPTPTVTPIPDNTPPTVSITSPINGSFVAKTSNVTVSAIATDSIGVSKVMFYVDNDLECTDTSSPYTCSFKATGRLGSAFNIKATAYDKSNNTASTSVVVTSN